MRAESVMFGEDVKAVAGPSSMRYVPLHALNELQQVRQSYDSAAISDLMHAITHTSEEGVVKLDLMHPPTVGVHTKASASRYINAHGEFFKIPHRERVCVDDLVPLPGYDDAATILIAGHRRKRAVGSIAKANGICPDQLRIATNVHENIIFEDAIGKQLRENVHQRPSAHEEAQALSLYFHFEKKNNGDTTVAQFARTVGFSETKVRDAIAFDSLPDKVKAFAISGVLPFGTVRQLKPLADALYRHYRLRGTDETNLDQCVEDELLAFSNRMASMRISDSLVNERLERVIRTKTDEILAQAAYQQDELFIMESFSSAKERRLLTDRALGDSAIRILQLQQRNGVMSSDALAMLEALIKLARAQDSQDEKLF